MISRQSGWIALSVIFLLVIIGSIIMIAYCLYLLNKSQKSVCFGGFGVQPLTGGEILNRCGTNRRTICSYNNIGGLNGAIKQCNLWSDICNAFIYNSELDIMSIIDPNRTFPMAQTDLYVRQ